MSVMVNGLVLRIVWNRIFGAHAPHCMAYMFHGQIRHYITIRP
jgi:hypothetical protein